MDRSAPTRSAASAPRHLARWTTLGAIALVGITATFFVAHGVRRAERRSIQTEFHNHAQERALAIERELRRVVTDVESTAALFHAYEEMDRARFSAFARVVLDHHEALQGFGFNPVVKREELPAHERAVRGEGFPDYVVFERDAAGRRVPVAEREEYVVVTFLEPLEGNEAALGYDIASDTVRLAALRRARDTGETTMSGRLRLVQEREDQYGALICVPVYRNGGTATATLQDRRAALRGYAVGVVRFGDILDVALRDLRPAGIDLSLIDESGPDSARLLHSSLAPRPDPASAGDAASLVPFAYAVEVAGRRLDVRGAPTAVWADRAGWTALAIFGVGLASTLFVVFALAWQSTVNRRLRRAMADHARAEERQAGFGRMLDESHDEIYVFDAKDLRFLHVNLGARTNLGYSMEELRAMTPLDLETELTPDSWRELLRPLRDGSRDKVVFETIHRRKHGSAYDVEVHLQLSSFDGAPAFVATVLDVTERRRIEERLRQSQRLEGLGTLAGGIAHDFNNVLTAIMGNAELACDQAPPESPLRKNLSGIVRAAERARDIVRQILAFSRRHPLERRPFELRETIAETLRLMRASLPTTIAIHQTADGSGPVIGDPTQIHQVLLNLCTNAGHAMRDRGGVLKVNLDEVELAEADAARPGGLAPGRYARITVRDSGHGMSREVAAQVFFPFFTTKGPGEGSGMGLAVAHGIVTGHGGAMTVTSEPGKGATFEVFLPVAERVENVESRSGALAAGGCERILIVDDEPAVVDVLSAMLGRAGYEVEAFSGADEALARFRERLRPIDLVITDYTMPRMTGTELALQIRDLDPEVPVILVSGYGELLDEAAMHGAGVSAVVAKPPRVPELLELIRALLAGAPGRERPPRPATGTA